MKSLAGCVSRHQHRATLMFVVVVLAFATGAAGQTFTVLHRFRGFPSDGSTPFGPVAQDQYGNLYGTSWSGGTNGKGTIFKIDTSGNETVLHSFVNQEGGYPQTGLVLDGTGNVYGTTDEGQTFGGSVFKFTPSGNLIVLHRFAQNGMVDGFGATGSMILNQGTLYGTTGGGGTGTAPGTVFQVDHRTGAETLLYSFMQQPDGQIPEGVIRDSQGNLYGTTILGGAVGYPGYGSIFKIDPTGSETVLYSFTGGADGKQPGAGLIRDAQGNLYGTTIVGGAFNEGVIFKLDPLGILTVLHDFGSSPDDGAQPIGSGVIRDPAGNFYGTTQYGGRFCCGTVYKLAPDGAFTVLHSFQDGNDGGFPWAGVIRDSAGNLYGTTRDSGDLNAPAYGVVFKISF